MRHLIILCLFSLITTQAIAQNEPPQITNLTVIDNGSNSLTFTYDLSDMEGDDVEISLVASDNNGQHFLIPANGASGDIGFPTTPGNGKSIEWNYTNQITLDGNYRFRLVADDRQVDIPAIVAAVDSNLLRTDLEFVEGIRHRTTGAQHLDETIDLMLNRFENAGLVTTSQSFDFDGYAARNVIGNKAGLTNEAELYILGGHFDTVLDSPGADDNGSAIVGILEALRVLAPYNFKRSLRFIGFDLEEEGLVGSLEYVDNGMEPFDELLGMFDFEMIGYYSDEPNSQTLPDGFELLFPEAYAAVEDAEFRGNFITNVGQAEFSAFRQAFDVAAAAYVPELRVVSLDAPAGWLVLTPDLGRSDHASFWLAGLPAIMLTDGANFRNEEYHMEGDTLGNLNFTFIRQVVQATVAAIAEEAGIQNSTFAEVNAMLTNTMDLGQCQFQVIQHSSTQQLEINASCTNQPLTTIIYQLNGREILKTSTNFNGSSIYVSTAQLPDGIYLLQVNGIEQTYSQKIMIANK